jgi:hypothetical protein
MSEVRLVRDETPVEFFREQLAKAMEHQHVSTSAFTEYYLVNLLASAVRGETLPPAEPGYDETPLALLYARALQAARGERALLLRALGDNALFVAGFFGDSLERQLVDLRYVSALGGRAYARLSVEEAGACGPRVFAELAGRFLDFADLLAEVSEASRLTNQTSVVKLYEKWERTRSRRAAILLAEQGIAPVAGEPGSVQ